MSFIDYLEQQEADTVTTSLAVSWATRMRPGASPARCGRRLAAVRATVELAEACSDDGQCVLGRSASSGWQFYIGA